MVGEAARQAGARIIATGDTAQLGAVEAGGMFRLLAQEVPAARAARVRRFDAQWEREASVQLRDGDLAAVAAYDRHGRIGAPTNEAAYDRAAAMWLADHLRGKSVLLLAGSNAEAAELSRRVRPSSPRWKPSARRRPRWPTATRRRRRSGPRPPQHRDRRRRPRTHQPRHPQGRRVRGPDAEVRRQRPDGTWTEPFRIPRSYLARNAELAYGGNVHVAQGRTVDTAHLLVAGDAVPAGPVRRHDPRPRSQHRARGHRPDRPARPPALPAGRRRSRARRVLHRDARTCPPPSRSARPRNGRAGPATCSPCGPPPSGRPCTRTSTSGSRPGSPRPRPGGTSANTSRAVLQHQLRAAQLAGHDIGQLIDRITAAPMDRARSISSVLHGRLQSLQLPDLGHDADMGAAHARKRAPDRARAGRRPG